MIPFDFQSFGRFVRGWIVDLPWTPRRALISLVFFLVYPPFALLTGLALAADRLLFPGLRHRAVAAPVFIIGNFRSGTTFLHRLLDKDRRNFRSMAMWEILFAPSVTQRRLFAAVARLDRLVGKPAARLRRLLERDWERRNVMHRVGLTEPEEDDYLLLHVFSALTVGLSAGLLDQARPYAWFDQCLSAAQRRRIMSFYRACVRRHLHAHDAPPGVHYLAKNPALCPKIDSLLAEFPDARIIYLARSPLEAVPSFVSMMRFSWQTIGVPAGPAVEAERRRFLLEMMAHWYRYPLERLAAQPSSRYAIVRYDDLTADPERTVTDVYRTLGLELHDEFRDVLRQEAAAAADHTSQHDYAAVELGLDQSDLVRAFRDVLQRFQFPSGDALPSAAGAPNRAGSPPGPG